MVSNGYVNIKAEKTIFKKTEPNGDYLIHGVFVDDMARLPSNPRIMREFLTKYNQEFNTTGGMEKDMDIFVGLELIQGPDGTKVHQDSYVRQLVEDYEKAMGEPLRGKRTPMSNAPDAVLGQDEPFSSMAKQKVYRSWVQRLSYPAVWTRPDLSFTVGTLARYGGKAGPSHWDALTHVMGYLKKHPSFHLHYRRGGDRDPLSGFVDSDWSTPCSITGYVTLFNKTPLSWQSKRQPTTALSTAEAEYMAGSVIAKELIYLRRLYINLGFSLRAPTPVGEDNSACIEWTNYVIGGRERAKHIDLRKHFAHQAVQDGEIYMYKVASADQLADLLTKSLTEPLLLCCVYGLLQLDADGYPT